MSHPLGISVDAASITSRVMWQLPQSSIVTIVVVRRVHLINVEVKRGHQDLIENTDIQAKETIRGIHLLLTDIVGIMDTLREGHLHTMTRK
jgi:hypothetical protein